MSKHAHGRGDSPTTATEHSATVPKRVTPQFYRTESGEAVTEYRVNDHACKETTTAGEVLEWGPIHA